jgi:DNA polymerase-3 subunit beta
MTVTATDIENTLRAECPVEGNKGKSRFVVMGRQFIDLVKGITAESVEVDIKESVLEVSVGKSKYRFPLMQADEFPITPKVEKTNCVSVNGAVLANCLRAVAFCVDKDEPRPHFRGVLVDVKKDKIVFVGTDTRTLAIKSMDNSAESEIKILLPLKAVSILSKALDGDTAELCLSKNTLYAEGGNVAVMSQLLAGVEDFPDYDKVVPSKGMENAEVKTAELKKSIERLTVFLTERYNKLTLLFTEGKLELSVKNPEKGEAKEEIAVGYAGKEQKLAFNPVISEFINRANGDTLTLGIKDGKSPMLMTGEDKDWKYVAMPLRAEE